MTVLSPADEARENEQWRTEGNLVIAAKLKGAVEAARKIESTESSLPKVDVEKVVAAFPEYLQRIIRRSLRRL